MKTKYIYLTIFLIIVGVKSFLNFKNDQLKEMVSTPEFKAKLNMIGKKKINDLVLDIEGWEVLDENKLDKFNIGSILLLKKQESKELNFSVLYQQHTIDNLIQYCRHNMKKELRNYKDIQMRFVDMYEVDYKGVKAIREDYIAHYKEPIDIEVITFKYKRFYYRVTYVKDKLTLRLLAKIKFM